MQDTNSGFSHTDGDGARSVAHVRTTYDRLCTEIHRTIVGQDEVLEQVLIAMFCGGHVLLEGVPGLAKTLLVSTIARAMSLQFNRIQFTPDLMPSDMTGTEVIEEDKSTGTRQLRFVRGPIFANIILADEINRTPPKTQAALLEAMQERQVTSGGVAMALPSPFFVLATQNPIEQEGTYPLPEAQLDRFMFNVRIGYPTEAEELEIIRRTTSQASVESEVVLTTAQCTEIQSLVRSIPIADHVTKYAVHIVRATRVREGVDMLPICRDYLAWGAGPRASQFLVLAAKAKAILSGATHVTPAHVEAMVLPVMRHRIVVNFNAEADGVKADDVLRTILTHVRPDGTDPTTSKGLDLSMR